MIKKIAHAQQKTESCDEETSNKVGDEEIMAFVDEVDDVEEVKPQLEKLFTELSEEQECDSCTI